MPTADHNYTISYQDKQSEITYTIQPFVFLSFPISLNSPYISYSVDKYNVKRTIYSRKYELNDKTNLEVTIFSNSAQIPYGMYARRLMSYFCKNVLLYKQKEIFIGENNNNFLENVLGIKYKLGSKERKILNEQLSAFFNCFISIKRYHEDNINYSYENISLFSKTNRYFVSKDNEWVNTVTVTEEFYNCILDFPIPISQNLLLDKNANARKIDILNYFYYQNYIAYHKKIELFIPFNDLKELFGYEIKSARSFRLKLNEILKEVSETTKLKIINLSPKGFKLIPQNEALFEKKFIDIQKIEERKLANETENNIINSFKGKYPILEIKAAIEYAKQNNAQNLKSYVVSSFNSEPRWHLKLYQKMIFDNQKLLKIEYEKLDDESKNILTKEFIKSLNQLLNSGKITDKFKYIIDDLKKSKTNILTNTFSPQYCTYIWWLFKNNNFIALDDNHKLLEELFNLF